MYVLYVHNSHYAKVEMYRYIDSFKSDNLWYMLIDSALETSIAELYVIYKLNKGIYQKAFK